MPASDKFTVDLSSVELPDLELGSRRERRAAKQATPQGRDRSSSTVANRGKPAAQPKRYAFRRS